MKGRLSKNRIRFLIVAFIRSIAKLKLEGTIEEFNKLMLEKGFSLGPPIIPLKFGVALGKDPLAIRRDYERPIRVKEEIDPMKVWLGKKEKWLRIRNS